MAQPILVVVSDSDESSVPTVEHALREARDVRAEVDTDVEVRVTLVEGPGEDSIGQQTKMDVERVVEEFDAEGVHTRVETVEIGGDDETSRTKALLETIDRESLSRLVVAADTRFSVERLRESVGVKRLELTAADSPRERLRLLHPAGARRLAAIFGLTYLFYQAIGGFAGGLDYLTGAISAGVVAVSLSHVAFSEEPTLTRTGPRFVRFALFVPVLLWEIAKANVVIAYIILHPRLPIDPSMGTIETDTTEGLERMVLATSITLTPGTLVLDVEEREFTVHSLTADAQSGLVGGRLDRLVTWVFHGSDGPDTDGGGDQ